MKLFKHLAGFMLYIQFEFCIKYISILKINYKEIIFIIF
jgi:hypothetical protein